eukprot:TRINITY_DN6941_c0_g1_i1.p1 TRINITY_DN6941_c0_g1~~TRINITY_DN6941_c0_g1_i1.p1  ORF type:complete len:205 (+),score=53.37 TRINITY_DN6941_c0_g1_i1:280-894(+)
MGKKGLSLEEKRKRMLDFFYETEDVFQLKEVEKRCSKEKGITSMSVKDVLTSLVDDNMVHAEKIGTSNYYWAFPSEAASIRNNKKADFEKKIAELTSKEQTTRAAIEEETKGREPTEKRAKIMSDLEEARKQASVYDSELQSFRDCDPEVLEARVEQTKVAKMAVERWTDNIFNIRSWCKNKFQIDPAVFNKNFGIPADFDYPE